MDREVECFLNETAPLIVGLVMNGDWEDTLGRGSREREWVLGSL